MAGDTFYNLAAAYGTSLNAVIAANPDVDPNNLVVGSSIVVPVSQSVVPTNISYSYEIMRFNIQSLTVVFPFLETGSIGKSVLGNDLSYVRLGYGPKEIFYNASHHANEWITSCLLYTSRCV